MCIFFLQDLRKKKSNKQPFAFFITLQKRKESFLVDMESFLTPFCDWIVNDQFCLDLICRHIVKSIFIDANALLDYKSEWNKIFDRELTFCIEIREIPSMTMKFGSKFKKYIKIFGWDELGDIQIKHLPAVECRMFLHLALEGNWFRLMTSTHGSMKKDVYRSAFVGNDFLNNLPDEYKEGIKDKIKTNVLERARLLEFQSKREALLCQEKIKKLSMLK